MNLNYLKIIVLFASLLVSVSSYAASVNVSVKFYTGSPDPENVPFSTGFFTYDPEKDYCQTPCIEGVPDYDPILYSGVVTDSSLFGSYRLLTTAWYNPSAEDPLFKMGSLERPFRGDSNETPMQGWELLSEDTDSFGHSPNYRTLSMFSSGEWSSFDNGSTNSGYFTLTTPIPATAWLFASGLIGLLGFRRKQ